jgi:hypothetical protein
MKRARFACVVMLLPFVFLPLGGCYLFDGMGRHGSSAPVASKPSHVGVTLRNRCKHPVEVCYGTKEKCETLQPGASRKMRGQGGGVPVRLKDSDVSVSADATFSLIEIDESCTSVSRLLPDREPDTDDTVQ